LYREVPAESTRRRYVAGADSFSIFSACSPQKSLESGAVDLIPTAILVVVIALCVTAAVIAFDRRDAV
jgi:hypothetical protein